MREALRCAASKIEPKQASHFRTRIMNRRIHGIVWIIAILGNVSGCANISGTGRFGLADPAIGDVLTPVSKESRLRTNPRGELVVMAEYEKLCEGIDIGITLKAVEEAIPTNTRGKLFGSLQGGRVPQHLSLSALEVRFGNVVVDAPQTALQMFKEPHLDTLFCKCLSNGRLILAIKGGDGGEAYTVRFFYVDTKLVRAEVWQRGTDARFHVDRVWSLDRRKWFQR